MLWKPYDSIRYSDANLIRTLICRMHQPVPNFVHVLTNSQGCRCTTEYFNLLVKMALLQNSFCSALQNHQWVVKEVETPNKALFSIQHYLFFFFMSSEAVG